MHIVVLEKVIYFSWGKTYIFTNLYVKKDYVQNMDD